MNKTETFWYSHLRCVLEVGEKMEDDPQYGREFHVHSVEDVAKKINIKVTPEVAEEIQRAYEEVEEERIKQRKSERMENG